MYISIVNVGHKNLKYFINDQSEELNVPNIPSGYSLVFQEKYTNNIKVINDEELKQIFSNNTLFYQILGFNSSFKLSKKEMIDKIDDEIQFKNDKIFKITSDFKLNKKNLNMVDFIEKSNEVYDKNEMDDLLSSIQNRINKVNQEMNFINNNVGKYDKNEINDTFNLIERKLNECKNRLKNL